MSTSSETSRPAEAPRGLSNGTLRVLTAVVALPVVIAAAWAGGIWFAGLVAGAAVAAQAEFYRLTAAAGARPNVGLGLTAGAAVALVPLWPDARFAVLAAVVAFVCTVPFRHVATESGESNPVVDLAATLAGVVYPAALLATLTAIRLDVAAGLPGTEPMWATLAVFLLVALADTAAYYTGRSIGKTPLAPSVSPKKTREGAMGGVVGAMLGAWALGVFALPSVPLWAMLVLGVIAGVVSPLGDLAESRLKRAAGVKDSGTLLPGHGGFLDRLDALFVAAPLAYLVLTFALR